jgi:hypothetical protein
MENNGEQIAILLAQEHMNAKIKILVLSKNHQMESSKVNLLKHFYSNYKGKI